MENSRLALNRVTSQEMVEILAEAVIKKEPFSLVRFTDGDWMFLGLNSINNGSGKQLYDQILHTWFGRSNFEEGDLTLLHKETMIAYENADAIGVPEFTSTGVFLKAAQFAYEYIASFEKKYISHVSIHSVISLDSNLSRLIKLSGFTAIGIVTCRNVESVLKKKFGLKEIISYKIPTEAAWTRETVTGHFPETYEQLRKEMVVPYKGMIFLVGAGICGRVYCNWLKEQGAIAIDIGSQFDIWAGKITRIGQSRKEAIENLKVILEEQPELAEANADIAFHYSCEGQQQLAICHYELALKLEKNYYWYFLYAQTLMSLGFLNEALSAGLLAIELSDRKSEDAFIIVGDLYERFGNVSEMRKNYIEAIELLKNIIITEYIIAESLRKLGCCYEKIGELEKAVEVTQKAVNISTPENPYLMFRLALLLKRCEKLDEAVAQMRKAIKISPHDSVLQHHLGNLEVDRGCYAGRIAQEKAIERNEHNAGAYFLLSKIYFYQENFSQALIYAEQAVSIDAQNETYKNHLTRLELMIK